MIIFHGNIGQWMEAVRILSINYDWLTTDPPVEDTSMKHELYRTWKEAVIVCSKVPSQNFPQGMHEYHTECKSKIPHPRPYQTCCRTEIAQRWIQKGTLKMGLAAGNKECKINYQQLLCEIQHSCADHMTASQKLICVNME
jgi:hypothetical protein